MPQAIDDIVNTIMASLEAVGFAVHCTVALDSPTLAKSNYLSACPHLAQSFNRLFLALPTAFPDPYISYYSGCLMLLVQNLQGAELAHNYFPTLPKILHTLKKPVQGPCTPCGQFIGGRI